MDLNRWLEQTRLVVCVGAGGVGKTTTAATIGLWAAISGRKAMVLTIDPARRLANSLGLSQVGNKETRIDLSAEPDARGELWAMMLDSRGTFDNLIHRLADDQVVRDRILKNSVYRYMADTFAGSQDYMATEKLYDLVADERYDLIVLDTPPVKNALDFLESPGRVINFLDERVLGWFLAEEERKRIFGRRLMVSGSQMIWKLLGYVLGSEFLEDLQTFFVDFHGLYEGFRKRHDAVVALFRESTTGFVTVCAPTEATIDVAAYFQKELRERSLPRSGVVVNQVHRCEGDDHDAARALEGIAQELLGDFPPEIVPSVLARLSMAHRRLRELTIAEQEKIAVVRDAARGGGFFQTVPRLDGEVHDIRALREVGGHLFGPAAQAK